MNIKFLIIGLVAIGVVGGGAYFVTKDGGQGSQSNQADTERASLNDLLARGDSLQCTFGYTDDKGNKTTGTTYIDDNRMRGSFTVKTAGKPEQKSNILQDNEYQYYWNEGSSAGFKSKISDTTTAEDQQPDQDQQQTVKQDQQYDYSCTDWDVDEAVLSAPNEINFTDYSEQAGQKNTSQQAREATQQACAQITNQAAKETCEKALR